LRTEAVKTGAWRRKVTALYSALVAAGTEKGRVFFGELLEAEGFSCVRTTTNGKETRQMLRRDSFDLVLISAPLPDESGRKLAFEITETTASGVILAVKDETEQPLSKRLEDFGVFLVPKPVNRRFFTCAVKLVIAFRRRVLGLTNENVRLQKKIEEIRLVDRAKCTLMQYLSMTEDQAHHYIEKQAMDLRTTKREVAEGILKTYES